MTEGGLITKERWITVEERGEGSERGERGGEEEEQIRREGVGGRVVPGVVVEELGEGVGEVEGVGGGGTVEVGGKGGEGVGEAREGGGREVEGEGGVGEEGLELGEGEQRGEGREEEFEGEEGRGKRRKRV